MISDLRERVVGDLERGKTLHKLQVLKLMKICGIEVVDQVVTLGKG